MYVCMYIYVSLLIKCNQMQNLFTTMIYTDAVMKYYNRHI